MEFEEILQRVPADRRAAVQAWWDGMAEDDRPQALQTLAAKYRPVESPPAVQADVARAGPVSRAQGPVNVPGSVGQEIPRRLLPASAVPGPVTTAIREFANAGALNFGDELMAVGRKILNPANDYEEMRRGFEEQRQLGVAANPRTAASAQLTGGVVASLPLLGGPRIAAQGAGRILGRNLLEGAAYGGLSEAGAAQPGERLARGVEGAVVGGAVDAGIGIPGELLSGRLGTLRGRLARNLAEEGDADITAAMQRLREADPESPLMGADVLGPAAISRVGAIRSVPGRGQSVIREAFGARQAGRPMRVQSTLEDALGVAGLNPYQAAQDLKNARRVQAEELYESALAPEGREVTFRTAQTSGLLSIPRVQALVEDYRNIQRSGGQRIRANAPVTARELQYVKRELQRGGEGLTAGERAGVQAAGARDVSLVGRVQGLLETVPGYREADAAYREASGLMEAYDTGRGILNRDPAEVEFQFGQMSPNERRVLQLGIPAATERAIESGGARTALSRLGLGSSGRLGRARVLDDILPPDVQERFGRVVSDEELMVPAEQAALTGSVTTPLRESVADAAASGNLGAQLRRRVARSLGEIADPRRLAEEAEMLTAQGPTLRSLLGQAVDAQRKRGQSRRGFRLLGRLGAQQNED